MYELFCRCNWYIKTKPLRSTTLAVQLLFSKYVSFSWFRLFRRAWLEYSLALSWDLFLRRNRNQPCCHYQTATWLIPAHILSFLSIICFFFKVAPWTINSSAAIRPRGCVKPATTPPPRCTAWVSLPASPWRSCKNSPISYSRSSSKCASKSKYVFTAVHKLTSSQKVVYLQGMDKISDTSKIFSSAIFISETFSTFNIFFHPKLFNTYSVNFQDVHQHMYIQS